MDNTNRVYASFWLRFLATAIDWVLIALIASLFRFLLLSSFNSLVSLDLFIVFYPLFSFSYNVFCIYTYGATLGKRFAGIQVVKEEGRITLFEAIRREVLLKPVSAGFFGIGILTMFFNPKKQTYYDKKLQLVVLVKAPLSTAKRVFSFLISLAFATYLFSWTPFLYGILNVKNEQMRLDIINDLTQKKEIIEVMKDQEIKEYKDFYKKNIVLVSKQLSLQCEKRLLRILDKKTTCTFEDLSFDSLREIDKTYEDVIMRIVDLQTKMENEGAQKFNAASQPLPSRPGWTRFTDLSNQYYIDYPTTYSVHQEGIDKVMLKKNIVATPRGVVDYIFIQKGASFQWSEEEIVALRKMKIGESAVIGPQENSLPKQFLTYERLQDYSVGGKSVKAFINREVWEFPKGTIMYVYIYEGKDMYIFGGLTDENMDNKDNISQKELSTIVTTLRFLDYPTPSFTPRSTAIPSSPPTPTSLPSTSFEEYFDTYGSQYNVSKDLLKKIALCESGARPSAQNGAYGGMFQFASETWKSTRRQMERDENPDLRYDAKEAIETAAFKIGTGGANAWANCL